MEWSTLNRFRRLPVEGMGGTLTCVKLLVGGVELGPGTLALKPDRLPGQSTDELRAESTVVFDEDGKGQWTLDVSAIVGIKVVAREEEEKKEQA